MSVDRANAEQSCSEYHKDVFDVLAENDSEVCQLISREYQRVCSTLQLIAAENRCSKAVLAALGSVVQDKTTEGFAGARFHSGCEVVDEIETCAIERCKKAFGAQYANVQPHSGTQANQIVFTAILGAGDKILSLAMDQGGHVSHGAGVSLAGKFFEVEHYHVNKKTFLIDYDSVREHALEFCPKLIICGGSAYARTIDFARFSEIADEAGAYLMADISHIAGLIIAGAHRSPIDYAHFTTTSTYKPGGPRGGLILMGKDYRQKVTAGKKEIELCELVQKTTFTGVQGTPCLNNIAAKAVFFKEAAGGEYKARQFKIIENAKALASGLLERGFDVLTGGTDNHMVLINVSNFRKGLTGVITQKCLEDCGISVNMNRLPYDTTGPAVASGMRLGTPIVTRNGMGAEQMDLIAGMIEAVLKKVEILSETEYRIDESFKANMRAGVEELCGRFGVL